LVLLDLKLDLDLSFVGFPEMEGATEKVVLVAPAVRMILCLYWKNIYLERVEPMNSQAPTLIFQNKDKIPLPDGANASLRKIFIAQMTEMEIK
jgi:hypothetical protein